MLHRMVTRLQARVRGKNARRLLNLQHREGESLAERYKAERDATNALVASAAVPAPKKKKPKAVWVDRSSHRWMDSSPSPDKESKDAPKEGGERGGKAKKAPAESKHLSEAHKRSVAVPTKTFMKKGTGGVTKPKEKEKEKESGRTARGYKAEVRRPCVRPPHFVGRRAWPALVGCSHDGPTPPSTAALVTGVEGGGAQRGGGRADPGALPQHAAAAPSALRRALPRRAEQLQRGQADGRQANQPPPTQRDAAAARRGRKRLVLAPSDGA